MRRQRLLQLTWPLLILLLAAWLRLFRLATVPFGWHPDEATKALLARDVLAGKGFPVFFSAFTGREALFVYLEAALFALLGEHIFAGHLLSALVGLLTVATTYAAGRELFNRRTGLLAAALLTVSLWHLIASRNGYRAVLQPLVQLLVIWLLFRAWRRQADERSWRPLLWAGICLGLTQYTYTAARFFPFLIVAILLLARLLQPRLVRQQTRGLELAMLAALLVFLPLAVHFWQHPIDFYGRAAQISILSPAWSGGQPAARLWQSVRETGRMFTQWGDINYRFNIAGQPVFGPLAGAFFYAGLLLSLWRLWRERGLTRLAYATLWLWMGIMLLPMLLSAESLPYYQRAIGALPAIFFFPALALDAGGEWLARRTDRRPAPARLYSAFLVLLLAGLAWQTAGDYFDRWHLAERNDDDRRVAMVYVADYLRQEPVAGELYLSTQYIQHPTLAWLAPATYDGVRWFDARQSFPLPPDGQPATYILLRENSPEPQLLARLPALARVYTGYDRFDRPVFDVLRWPGTAAPQPAEQGPATWSPETTFLPGDPDGLRQAIDLPVDFGQVMTFLGYERSAESLQPGETLALVLTWRLEQKPERQYTIFAHLLDASGNVVAGYDANDYPVTFWNEAGREHLLSYFPLRLQTGTPAGEYQLEIGVYHQPSGERLPIYDGAEAVADRLLLAPVRVISQE